MLPREELAGVAEKYLAARGIEAEEGDQVVSAAIHKAVCEYLSRRYPALAKRFLQRSAFADELKRLAGSQSNRAVVAWLDHQISVIEPVVRENSRNLAQAERDMQVFRLWGHGLSAREIAAPRCPWLANARSVQQTLERVIMMIRDHFRQGQALPIVTNPSHGPGAARGNRKRLAAWRRYQARYYKARPELKDRSRERMRQRRAPASQPQQPQAGC